jgi:hypothetical protein
MVVLQETDQATLDLIGPAIRSAEQQVRLGTMIVTLADLQSSCDVFPVKFHDIQAQHRLLTGSNVLSDLVVSDEHLRLRCEQELKNLMIRSSLLYLRVSHKPAELWETLCDSTLSFLRVLPACLTVKTGITPEADTDVVDMFAADFGMDLSVVTETLKQMDAEGDGKEKSVELFGRFMQLVRDSAHAMDQLEETVGE